MFAVSVLVFALNAHATLSKSEQQIVIEAEKVEKAASNRPPPSKHMQDKMQSTFSDPQPAKPSAKPPRKPKHK